MKKIFLILLSFIIIISCSKQDISKEKKVKIPQNIDKETIFSFDINSIKKGCEANSDIICAINTTIKCIINPTFEDCSKEKNNMPSFVFMQDESLQRPTFQSYKITKLKPRSDGAIEVFTQSSCNGNWFGLCNGNIIYVIKNTNSIWQIIDIYAIEI